MRSEMCVTVNFCHWPAVGGGGCRLLLSARKKKNIKISWEYRERPPPGHYWHYSAVNVGFINVDLLFMGDIYYCLASRAFVLICHQSWNNTHIDNSKINIRLPPATRLLYREECRVMAGVGGHNEASDIQCWCHSSRILETGNIIQLGGSDSCQWLGLV